jgi:GxxExxY protein
MDSDVTSRIRAEIHRKNARVAKEEAVDPLANECSFAVIGAAIDVQTHFGPGLLERTYEDALLIELEYRGIKYQRQVPFELEYRGRPVKGYQIDLIVENVLLVELKAVSSFLPIHIAQTLAYLKVANLQLGLLLNFHAYTVGTSGIKRVINT